MKTKLTITIDEDLLPEFKNYAASMGESLSQVVEETLKQAIAKKNTKKITFAEKWRGCLNTGKPFRKTKKVDPKWEYLSKKHNLK